LSALLTRSLRIYNNKFFQKEKNMIKKILITKITILLFVALCCIGCGPSTRLKGLVPVEGVVYYDGQPIEEATVMFDPGDPTNLKLRSAIGVTDADGKFTLTTLNPKDGIAPGEYKVAISKYKEGPTGAPISLLPEKYDDVNRSGFTATVPKRGVKDLRFDLEK
jgi:hypothetical protein